MDLHPNARPESRQEVRCRDCGHVYTVEAGARSSRCEVCGNIEFHTNLAAARTATGAHSSSPQGAHFSLPPELLQSFAAKNAATQSVVDETVPEPEFKAPQTESAEDILARFRAVPDGLRVQEIIERYQVEWQLWATLVKNFADPAYHAAYLAMVTGARAFDEASVRYREHRSVMALSENTRWEAEVADLMISRIESLTALRMEQEGGRGFRLATWLYLLPLQSRPFRIAWITLGMLAMARLFRVI